MLTDLKQLAEGWRSAATRIENKFSANHPESAKQIVQVLEHCAEELEVAVKKSETASIVNPTV